MRVFIAIEPSEHVKSKIFHEFENLEKKNLFKGKFVERQNLHLTLKFIGDVSEEKIYTAGKKILNDEEHYNSVKIKLNDVKNKLGNEGASARAAKQIYAIMNET